MGRYLFELGHQPHIGEAEINAVLSSRKVSWYTVAAPKGFICIETDKKLDLSLLQHTLGGTKKICEAVEEVAGNPAESIAGYLLDQKESGKIVFSLSGEIAKTLPVTVKKILKGSGMGARFVPPKNAATILYNGLVDRGTDLSLYGKTLWVTRAIQEFEDFASRDYGRPDTDDKSGMLPPKLARILVNLSQGDTASPIYDPSCGSGTILTEAATLGYTALYGSDISSKAVDDTKRNVIWIKDKYNLDPKATIFVHDITQPVTTLSKKSIGAIVTEPFLGKPLTGRESHIVLETEARSLSLLYRASLKNLAPLLSDNQYLVMVVPRFHYRNQWVTIPSFQKDAIAVGLTPVRLGSQSDYLLYHRPHQHLGREIWKLKKAS